MENENKDLDLIESWLRGESTKEFEDRLDNDPELSKEVDLTSDLIDGINYSHESRIKSKLKAVEEKLDNESFFDTETKTLKMENNKQSKKRWVPMAAALALMVAAGMFIMNQPTADITNPQNLYADHYKPDTKVLSDVMDRLEAPGLASTKTASDDSLILALKHYQNFDYNAARSNLSKYLDSYPENQTARFYMGLTQLQLGNYARSTGYLQPLCSEQDFPYQDAAKWYLSMGLSQVDGPDGMSLATKYLNQLASDNKSEYQGNAKAYLQAIKG